MSALLTTVITGLISGIFGAIGHKYATSSATPAAVATGSTTGTTAAAAAAASTDAFSALGGFGLPGHPILNTIFGGLKNMVNGAPSSAANTSTNQAAVAAFANLLNGNPALSQLMISLLTNSAAPAQTTASTAAPASPTAAAAAGS